MYIAPGQGQATPWGQIVSLTHLFFQFSPCCKFSPLNGFVTVFPIQMYMRPNLILLKNRSWSTRVIIYINFVELGPLMLHAKFQDHRTSVSGEEYSKGFYHI